MIRTALKPNLLCIAPPYPLNAPPAGAAALLGYLKAAGCHDFDFLDLRLFAPYSYAPTYRPTGAYGESFVIDVPDLPLVLGLLRAFDEGGPLIAPATELFDRFCLERGLDPATLHRYLAQLDRFFAEVAPRLAHVEFLGLSVWTSNYLASLMLAAHLKRGPKPPFIVAGGPQVSESASSAKLGLASGLFDAVAVGEGEETLLSLYEEFRRGGGRPFDAARPVAGALQLDRASGEFRRSERKLLRLASLPLPSFDEMSLASYPTQHGTRTLPYQLSRGCTDECSFCSEWVFWQKFRLGSTEHALEQLAELKRRYRADLIWFTDSLLNGKLSRLREFAEGALARDLELMWFGFMRADIDAETAALARRAGCTSVFVGVESLSDETLELMNKRMTEAKNLRALETMLEAGIQVRAGVIPGFPGDSRAGFARTVEGLGKLQRRFGGMLTINVEPFLVSPGQPLFAELGRYGLTARPWAEEYLAIAPRYGELTGAIPCTVEGSNQGLERLGQQRMAVALTAAKVGAAADPFSYNVAESHSSLDVELAHLAGDWHFAQLKAPSGLRWGLILSSAEKETYFRMKRGEAFFGSDVTVPLLEREPFAGFFTRVAARHLFAPSPVAPGVARQSYRAGLDGAAAAARSPHLLARRAGPAPDAELLLLNLLHGELVRLPAAAAALFTALADGPRALAELATFAGDDQLALLSEKGLIELQDAAEAEPFVPRPAALPLARASEPGCP